LSAYQCGTDISPPIPSIFDYCSNNCIVKISEDASITAPGLYNILLVFVKTSTQTFVWYNNNVVCQQNYLRGASMSMLGDNWCTIEEVESKFGVSKALVLEWVKEGIIRSEEQNGKVFRVNIDDLGLKIEEDLG
jgi:hypothetical protein